MISEFRNKYWFLSNFYPCDVVYDGLKFKSVESAFQSAKTPNIEDRKVFINLSARDAKRQGRSLMLRSDWENIKEEVMYKCLQSKFSNKELSKALIETYPHELVETNTWGDTYWGIYNKIGDNRLGKLLMQLRDELRNN